MQYVLFTNRLGKTHKMWSKKEGNLFVPYKQDDIYAKRDPEDDLYDATKYQEYKMWDNKKFSTKDESDEAILKYVDLGLKAGIFKSKEVKE